MPPLTAFSLAGPRGPRRPRIEDEKHLRWIRTLPCLISGQYGVEAAHVRYHDPRFAKRHVGIGEKPDDRWTVPLHHLYHRTGPDAQHNSNEREWWKRRNIDPVVVAAALYVWSGDDHAAMLILSTARMDMAP
jgi:hypothetical protein